MFDTTRIVLFFTAALLLAIAPGPGMLYVLARSLAGGKREGVLSALGTFVGGMVHVFAAALGVSIILAKSAMGFRDREIRRRSLFMFSRDQNDPRSSPARSRH
jgi:threonine/homoserine/homoserine lactone efflux protein